MSVRIFPLAGAVRALLAGSALAVSAQAQAAGYPERPVRILVGVQAGASTDTLARLVAQKLGDRLGQPFIVENRTGAATRIGMETMARAPADGYTLGLANAVTTSFPLMFDNFPFVPGKDFVPVSMVGRAPSFLAVRSTLPVRNVAEFIAYAKANSGKLSFGYGGAGSNPHVAALTLVRSLGVKAIGAPYKGNAPTAMAVGAGEVDFAMLEYAAVRPMVERGNVRLLAVTEPKRFALLPDVPTSTEQGLTREIEGMTPWFMWMAPAGTPKPVVELLNRHVNEILKLPEVQQPLRAAGIEPEGSTTAAATDYFLGERARITRLSQELGVSFKE
ncbi:Tripartite tricarboxylate transporter family receptor [compost metagenome]